MHHGMWRLPSPSFPTAPLHTPPTRCRTFSRLKPGPWDVTFITSSRCTVIMSPRKGRAAARPAQRSASSASSRSACASRSSPGQSEGPGEGGGGGPQPTALNYPPPADPAHPLPSSPSSGPPAGLLRARSPHTGWPPLPRAGGACPATPAAGAGRGGGGAGPTCSDSLSTLDRSSSLLPLNTHQAHPRLQLAAATANAC